MNDDDSGEKLRGALSRWNPWRGLGGLPRDFWVLFAATLINRSGTMVLPFLVLYLTQSLHLAASRAGAVLAIYGATSLAASWLSGRLSDRLGPPRIMTASLLISGTILVLFPLATSFASIVGATVALAIAAEAFRPASFAIVSEIVAPERRKAAFSANRLAVNLGMSIGPALGGLLVTQSFHALFWFDGATSLGAGLLLVFMPLHVARAPKGEEDVAASPRRTRSATPLANPRLLVFLAATIPCAAIFFQTQGALSLFLVRDLGLPESVYGLLFTVNTILIVLLEVRLNLATSHWSHRRSLVLGALLVGSGFGSFALCRGAWSACAATVVWTFGEMTLVPSMANYVADIAPPDRRGEYMGLFTMSWGIAFTFGPWLGVVTYEHFGAMTLWVACLASSMLAIAIFSRISGRDGGGNAVI